MRYRLENFYRFFTNNKNICFKRTSIDVLPDRKKEKIELKRSLLLATHLNKVRLKQL